MENTLNKPLVGNLVYSLLGKRGSGDWRGKPASWPDIRKNLIPNSIRLLADDRYPLGFAATATGGYSVYVDGKKYGDYANGAQCSFTTSDWEIDEDLPIGYKRVQGYTCDNNVLWQITNFKLKGSDTVKISFSVNVACNVFGCYQGADATDNYDLYVSTTSGSKYLRYGSGTYLSYWSSSNLGQRFDVTFSPTGTSGMPQDSTWSQLDFTSTNDLLIGSTSLTGTSAKLKGNLYGNIEVVGRLNLIPCERLSDNALGYYDTYSKTFYEPSGTPTSMGYDTTHLFSYPIDYPTGATKAHIVDIYPTTEGNNITSFKCSRVAASGNEEQGVLWAHFNITNSIDLQNLFMKNNDHINMIVLATTARNNLITSTNLKEAFYGCYSIEYLPAFSGNNNNINIDSAFRSCEKIKDITLKNAIITNAISTFYDCHALEKIKAINVLCQSTVSYLAETYKYCFNLKDILPTNYTSSIQYMMDYIESAKSLKETILDVRNATNLKVIGTYGSSTYFMATFKGLRVSDQAPFDYEAAPQINVSYTGMDRNALVQLFNDLPTVNAGQIINVTGCTGVNDLTDDDKAIATAKNWTITL